MSAKTVVLLILDYTHGCVSTMNHNHLVLLKEYVHFGYTSSGEAKVHCSLLVGTLTCDVVLMLTRVWFSYKPKLSVPELLSHKWEEVSQYCCRPLFTWTFLKSHKSQRVTSLYVLCVGPVTCT